LRTIAWSFIWICPAGYDHYRLFKRKKVNPEVCRLMLDSEIHDTRNTCRAIFLKTWRPEVRTLVLWLSRSMLDLNFFIFHNLIFIWYDAKPRKFWRLKIKIKMHYKNVFFIYLTAIRTIHMGFFIRSHRQFSTQTIRYGTVPNKQNFKKLLSK